VEEKLRNRVAAAATSVKQCCVLASSDVPICGCRNGVSVSGVTFCAALKPETARYYDASLIINRKRRPYLGASMNRSSNGEKAYLHLPKGTPYLLSTAPFKRSSLQSGILLGVGLETCNHRLKPLDKTKTLLSLSSPNIDSSSLKTSGQ
jgi:hypothetical protein